MERTNFFLWFVFEGEWGWSGAGMHDIPLLRRLLCADRPTSCLSLHRQLACRQVPLTSHNLQPEPREPECCSPGGPLPELAPAGNPSAASRDGEFHRCEICTTASAPSLPTGLPTLHDRCCLAAPRPSHPVGAPELSRCPSDLQSPHRAPPAADPTRVRLRLPIARCAPSRHAAGACASVPPANVC